MGWIWLVGVGTLAAILLWAGGLGSRNPERRTRKRARLEEEEFRIDPEAVPEFKPTWREKR
jgi:hypothetical protein